MTPSPSRSNPVGTKPMPKVTNPQAPITTRKFTTQASLDAYVWGICNILRCSNCARALQYVPELTWILFLRILDDTEAQEAERAEAVSAPFAVLRSI